MKIHFVAYSMNLYSKYGYKCGNYAYYLLNCDTQVK